MKNVVIVYHYFAHYRRAVLNSLDQLDPNLTKITLISDCKSNLDSLEVIDFDKDKFKNIEYHRVKNKEFGKFLFQNGLGKKLNEIDPDVIVFLGQFNFISTWIFGLYFRLLGKRIVFWGHGVYGNEKGLKKVIRDIFNLIPNAYMTYGCHAKNLMATRCLKRNSISVIYNSLDTKKQNVEFDKLRELNFTKDADSFTILFIGRLTKVKKLDFLILAVNKLLAAGVDIKVNIIGEGSEKEKLERLSEGYKDNYIFHGAIHSEESVSRIIYNSHVCVSPGNVGLTAMHSLVYGTPVITHDDFSNQMPEFESIKDNISGSFYKSGDISSLMDKIMYWYEKYKCMDAEEIRVACREVIIENYNPDSQRDLILKVINDD